MKSSIIIPHKILDEVQGAATLLWDPVSPGVLMFWKGLSQLEVVKMIDEILMYKKHLTLKLTWLIHYKPEALQVTVLHSLSLYLYMYHLYYILAISQWVMGCPLSCPRRIPHRIWYFYVQYEGNPQGNYPHIRSDASLQVMPHQTRGCS